MTKRLLATLRRDVNDAKNGTDSNRSELKIRENVVDTFTRKFIVVINEYQEVQREYSYVASESRDVLILEASVVELHGMFLDFALVVGEEGDVLDNIEYNVISYFEEIDYVGCDFGKYTDAKKMIQDIRRKQCCIATTFFLIIIVIIIIIVISQLLQGSLKLK